MSGVRDSDTKALREAEKAATSKETDSATPMQGSRFPSIAHLRTAFAPLRGRQRRSVSTTMRCRSATTTTCPCHYTCPRGHCQTPPAPSGSLTHASRHGSPAATRRTRTTHSQNNRPEKPPRSLSGLSRLTSYVLRSTPHLLRPVPCSFLCSPRFHRPSKTQRGSALITPCELCLPPFALPIRPPSYAPRTTTGKYNRSSVLTPALTVTVTGADAALS